jgi:hypothetical protein
MDYKYTKPVGEAEKTNYDTEMSADICFNRRNA